MVRSMTGIVASDKGNKTIVVAIDARKTHPIYKKQYLMTRRIMAHDETNQAQVGDTVTISETRPLSARKRFILTKIVERAAIRHVEPEPEPVTEVIEEAQPKAVAKPRTKKESVK